MTIDSAKPRRTKVEHSDGSRSNGSLLHRPSAYPGSREPVSYLPTDYLTEPSRVAGDGGPGTLARASAAVTVTGRSGVIGVGGKSKASFPPARQEAGSAKTTLQPEHWYSPLGRMSPDSLRSITRR
jgi:hypothetical protein